MREELLHFLWKYKKFDMRNLRTTSGQQVLLLSAGILNENDGPDFFNSRVIIGSQEWAGNVEIHINSSDWYAHGHETDPNYDNVVLHVVWNHDIDIFRKNNVAIPVLELKQVISEEVLLTYRNLLEQSQDKWINCEKDFHSVDDFLLKNWLERLYFERLEEKTSLIFGLLEKSSNNWEEVLFKMLARNFGLNLNGEAFLNMASSIPFSVVRKVRRKGNLLEALFLGQAGLLEKKVEEGYYVDLQKEYGFLKHKFSLSREGQIPLKFFRLRPDNFPNLRLAQLSSLYQRQPRLFSEVIKAETKQELYKLLEVGVSEFWESHYTFQKGHSRRKKQLSHKFKDLLIINTLIPIKFCYARRQGREQLEEIYSLMSEIKPESNRIVDKFNALRPESAVSAMDSQALLQLKQNYCDMNSCLSCSLGVNLLQGERQI